MYYFDRYGWQGMNLLSNYAVGQKSPGKVVAEVPLKLSSHSGNGGFSQEEILIG